MIQCPHCPTDSRLDGTCDRRCAPDGHRDTPNNSQSLWLLHLTAPACVSALPVPLRPCPHTDASWSLRPTPRPVLIHHIGLWQPHGDIPHNGNSRAPDEPRETAP